MTRSHTVTKRRGSHAGIDAGAENALGAAGKLNFDVLKNTAVKSMVADNKLVSERRSKLIATAIELFSANGYHNTTVKELASKANVSPGSVYQYFSDKEDILFLSLQIVVHSINRVIPAAIEKVDHPVAKFTVAFGEYCKIVDHNRKAVQLTYRESKSLKAEYRDELKRMEDHTNRIIADCIQTCIQNGYMRDVDLDVFVYHVILSAQMWALKYWKFRTIFGIDAYIEKNLDILLHSVLTPRGWDSYSRYTASVVLAGPP